MTTCEHDPRGAKVHYPNGSLACYWCWGESLRRSREVAPEPVEEPTPQLASKPLSNYRRFREAANPGSHYVLAEVAEITLLRALRSKARTLGVSVALLSNATRAEVARQIEIAQRRS